MANDLPNLDTAAFMAPETSALFQPGAAHPPKILLLYGSLRQRSFSRLVSEEAQRLLQAMGAETRMFDPAGLPLPG